MKWILFLFILFFASCAQVATRLPAGAIPERHVVFDIDWTIVSEIKNPNPLLLKNPRVIEVQGTFYFINEGLEEFISDILSHSEINVSFYSGGKLSRNLELLSKIKLKNGKSLREVAYKILGSEELVAVDAQVGASFAERYKKDLTKVSKNLDDLIMFDDTANFVLDSMEDQSSHVFFIGKAFEYFENFQDSEGMTGTYIPKNYDEWYLNRKKLYILNEAFKEAYLESVEKSVPLSEALKKREDLLNLKNHEWNFQAKSYYTKNQNKIPNRLSTERNCHEMARILFGL